MKHYKQIRPSKPINPKHTHPDKVDEREQKNHTTVWQILTRGFAGKKKAPEI